MLTNDRDRRTCAKYSAYDETGHVHCHECPLNYKHYDGMWPMECKAFMHYDRHRREWVEDEKGEHMEGVPATSV